MTQEITWTPVPAGARDDRGTSPSTGRRAVTYRLAVHVSPRVTGLGQTAKLGEYPDFLDWLPTGLTAEIGVNKTRYTARQVSVPERGLWRAIFDADTPVRAGDFQDFSGRPIHTLPSSNLQAFLRDRWGRAAVAFGDDHPDPATLAGPDWFEPLIFAPDVEGQSRRARAVQALDQALAAGGVVPPRPPLQSADSITTDVVEALRFHEPRGDTKPFDVKKPDPDFHEMLAFLGNHPALLRPLGLVVDFEFVVPGGLPAQSTISFTPNVRLRTSTSHLTPAVASISDMTTFAPRPRAGSDLSDDGYLRLDDQGRFDVVQVDTDGATFNAVNFAQLVHSRANDDTIDEPAALPALRSGGVAVARPGLAADLAQRLDAATQHRQDLERRRGTVLYADDLVRGWRIDVHNSGTGTWHALCDQDATYRFDRTGRTVQVRQEGVVTLTPTTAADQPDTGDLYLQETLARWGGWSLVAERPGAGIGPSPDEPVERVEHQRLDRYPVSTSYAVPAGSLPVLRFGTSLGTGAACHYRLRARAVTICGDSVAFHPVGADHHATPVFDYLRFEPVGSPVVVLRDPRTAGESIERVVLRSNFDTAPTTTPARHVLPPRVSQLLVEHHGAVDRSVVTGNGLRIGPRPDQYSTLAALDANSLATAPEGVDSPGDRDGVKHYPVDRLPVPYLVDPLAEGIALRGVPAAEGTLRDLFISWEKAGAAWPDFTSVRIELAEGTGDPVFDETAGVVTVFVPKATMADIRVSSMIRPDGVATMGLWSWAQQAGATFDPTDIARGTHWMFTPFRTVTLVHAVRQPLAEPLLLDLGVPRRRGMTFAPLRGGLRFDQPSTGHLSVHATWAEWVDAGPGAPAPTVDAASADDRFATPVDVSGDGPQPANAEWTVELDARHEFGDTKHRVVAYTPEAVSRFGEYFIERDRIAARASETVVLDQAGLVPGFVTVTSTDRETTYTAGSDFTVDHDAGSIDLQPAGTTIPTDGEVEVSWLPRPATRLGAVPREIGIPSSSRPRVPEVAEVVPTFGWDRSTSGSSTRHGRGLRILLERPWWSSGEDERLAVVVLDSPPSGPQLDPALAPYVTRWAQDPVFASAPLPAAHPAVAHFLDTAYTTTGLTADETGGTSLAAAVYDVHFDADRDLWFADVVVDIADAYMPWVRLALARHQPHSVEGVELSPITTVDLAQLTADRTLVVNAATGLIRLSGPSYHQVAGGRDQTAPRPGPGTARAFVEVRPAGDGRELAWQPLGDPIELVGSFPTGSGQAVWSGTGSLPRSNEKNEFRLTVLQYEQHLDRDENVVERPVHLDTMAL